MTGTEEAPEDIVWEESSDDAYEQTGWQWTTK